MRLSKPSAWATSLLAAAAAATVVILPAARPARADHTPEHATQAARPPVDKAMLDKMLAGWPERPRLGAAQMIAKYGLPQEATADRLVWHDAGPFKRICLTKQETPHDFPLPHMDYLEHTIAYRVPAGKAEAIIDFDGSTTIDRTAGEMSAKCDLEGHNVLTLNLANDIATGKKTVAEARKAFGEAVGADVRGEHPPIVEKLLFDPAKSTQAAAYADEPVIPGSPRRAPTAQPGEARPAAAGDRMTDGEILATVNAIDLNEVLAASEAEKKQLSPDVLAYAKMLHMAHGKHMEETMMLGQKANAPLADTAMVDALKVKGAGELAALVPIDGEQFATAYLAAMVKGHTEALETIDGKLMKAANSDAVKQHLTATRAAVAEHLEKAKTLQAAQKR